MKIICPNCQAPIGAGQCNVAANVALCELCSQAFSLSNLVTLSAVPDGFDIHDPPPGAWFEDAGNAWQLGATTRSPLAFIMVPFLLFWSGLSIGGLYVSQFLNGEFSLLMSLFGIPFLAGSVWLGGCALMTVCGKVVIIAPRHAHAAHAVCPEKNG